MKKQSLVRLHVHLTAVVFTEEAMVGSRRIGLPVVVGGFVLLVLWAGREQGGPVELLEVHSASYYDELAKADQWQAGPEVQLASPPGGRGRSGARTQALTEVGRVGRSMAAKLSERLVKVHLLLRPSPFALLPSRFRCPPVWSPQDIDVSSPLSFGVPLLASFPFSFRTAQACSSGDNSACDKIANDPSAVTALRKAIDGGSGRRRVRGMMPRRAAAAQGVLASDFSSSSPSLVAAVAPLQQVKKAGGSKGLWDTRSTMWDSKRWQSGGVDDIVSSQWLTACTNGDNDACRHIGSSNSVLHALLSASTKAGGQPLADFEEPDRVPEPVFEAAKPRSSSGSWLGSLMDELGLGDSFTHQTGTARAPPKMIPDVGLDGKGDSSQAVWNDGTVAEGLSDDMPRAEAEKDISHKVSAAARQVRLASGLS